MMFTELINVATVRVLIAVAFSVCHSNGLTSGTDSLPTFPRGDKTRFFIWIYNNVCEKGETDTNVRLLAIRCALQIRVIHYPLACRTCPLCGRADRHRTQGKASKMTDSSKWHGEILLRILPLVCSGKCWALGALRMIPLLFQNYQQRPARCLRARLNTQWC